MDWSDMAAYMLIDPPTCIACGAGFDRTEAPNRPKPTWRYRCQQCGLTFELAKCVA